MLIVIEGVDGSGKETQTKLLYEKLSKNNKVKMISFPMYEKETSTLVKMYLGGKFGENADDVNPYAASMFFAADRVGSYLSDWKTNFDNGEIIIADRYTISNAIHQACKLENDKIDGFVDWLYDFEFNKCGLPKPDVIIFLNMEPNVRKELISKRDNKIDGSKVLDIHERNEKYLMHSYETAMSLAKKQNWHIINCSANNKLRTIEEINGEILSYVNSFLIKE